MITSASRTRPAGFVGSRGRVEGEVAEGPEAVEGGGAEGVGVEEYDVEHGKRR
jgi:hypothetical protein